MIDSDSCAIYRTPTVRLTELHRMPSGTSCQTVQPKKSHYPVNCRLNQPRLCDNWLNCESVLNHLLHSCSLVVDPTLLRSSLLHFPLLVLLHLALFQKLAEATPLSDAIPKADEGKGNNAHGQT